MIEQPAGAEVPDHAARRRPPLFDDASRHVDRFGTLLAVTAVTITGLGLVDLTRTGDLSRTVAAVVASALAGVTLLIALRASGLSRRWQNTADALVSAAILGVAALELLGASADEVDLVTDVTQPLLALLAVLVPIVVVRRLLRHRQVTMQTLIGAVAAYLLIPVSYFYVLSSIGSIADGNLFGHPEPTTSTMYFSLSTVTTTGYGDLVASGDLARLAATSEALIGQVYLVTFVALIVSLGAGRFRSSRGGAA